jgi:acyl carrier protein
MTPEDVVSRVFNVSRDRVSDATSNAEVADWDSLGHMTLIVELESVFGVSVSAEDALAMTDVASIKRILSHRGARW